MSKPAIRVEGLSKSYRLGAIGRHTLVDEAQHLWCKLRGKDPNAVLGKVGGMSVPVQTEKEFWALKDVSFEVQAGEVLGVIGGNGAGKSTLLKILSRITEPTSGTATIRGRVGSLLEVGTGFHPELTGRENVFMNGTILGMRKREVAAKFDEIVAFSGIEKFIDTPVKRYSSGMHVRLAFAVAAHLEPEILIVDEVLAVGDAEFQKRCLGKMGEVAKEGRTVLFVSHNMAAVENLCTKAILLHHGKVMENDTVQNVLERYLNLVQSNQTSGRVDTQSLQGKDIQLLGLQLQGGEVSEPNRLRLGQGFTLDLKLKTSRDIHSAGVLVGIFNGKGQKITSLHSRFTHGEPFPFKENREISLQCRVKALNLNCGVYTVNIGFRDELLKETILYRENACQFEVIPSDVYGNGNIPEFENIVFFDANWTLQEVKG